MLQEPKFLSAGQFLLTTLIVKLAVMAALATMLARYRRFRHILIFEQRNWPDRLVFAVSLIVPFVTGVVARLLLNYEAGDLTLEVRGESPLAYFPGPSTLEVRAANSLLGRVELRGDFTVRIGLLAATIEAAGGRMVLTTTQTFSPAERDGSGDRRRLGLRLFAVDLVSGLPAGASGQIPAQNTSDLR